MEPDRPCAWLAGEPFAPNADLAVVNKYTAEVAARVPLADARALERAVAAADAAAADMRALPAHARRDALLGLRDGVARRHAEFARAICVEVGKTIRDARVEVDRCLETLRVSAEEAVRIGGEVVPLDVAEHGEPYLGLWKRVPAGPVACITPFNFPLNLAAHKVAPAIAAGCPFLLKPAPRTPLSALLLGELLAECGLPKGAFSVLPASNEDAAVLVEDERVRVLSFTGSARVGWELKARAGRKRVVLELGGNAAAVVDLGADLDHAVARLAAGCFYVNGQSCIRVQRILVHTEIYDQVRDRLVEAARALRSGDPLDERTDLGPLVEEREAERVAQWVGEAIDAGGRALVGGGRSGAFVEPTLLEDVPRDCRAYREEIFGPVSVLSRFSDFEAALREVNDSRYGLQAGVFTPDLSRALAAWDRLECGAVVVNDVPSVRIDNMPYGGVKESGFGREGPRHAIEDLTELRLLLVRR